MKLQNKTTTRLGGYLTAAVSCGTLASTASAAVVSLDISSIAGPNANLGVGDSTLIYLLPGNRLFVGNDPAYYVGVNAGRSESLYLAMKADGSGLFKFGSGSVIDNTANWDSYRNNNTYFYYKYGSPQPAWGSDSYIGFKANSNSTPLYGWLKATWDPTSKTFEILSGAYENQPGVGITTPVASAVPETSNSLVLLGVLAAGASIRRRKQAA